MSEKDLGISAYSMFDKKNNSWGQPMFFKTTTDLARSLHLEFKNPRSVLGDFAADFAVYDVGYFDQRKGVFVKCDIPQFVAEALEYQPVIRKENSNVSA